jgi:hypothetical protein
VSSAGIDQWISVTMCGDRIDFPGRAARLRLTLPIAADELAIASVELITP